MDEFQNDPGALMEHLIGFNPVAALDEWQEDPWGALESLTKGITEAGMAMAFGSSPAFNMVLKALSITQMVLPALQVSEQAPSIFAMLDTYTTGGFDNWKSMFVN